MRTTVAVVMTAGALVVGCFLLGYGYAEWWQEREPVHIEGLVWQFGNSYVSRRDVYYDRSPRRPVAYEALPLREHFGDWPYEAGIRVSYYSARLPARSREIGLEGLADLSPPFLTLRLYVEPDMGGSRDRHGMINVPARYVVSPGVEGYVFEAPNEWEAERMAKEIVWEVFEEKSGGIERFFKGGRG